MPYLPSSSPLLDLNSYPSIDEVGATEERNVPYMSHPCRTLRVREPFPQLWLGCPCPDLSPSSLVARGEG